MKELTAKEYLTELLLMSEGYDAISRDKLKKHLDNLSNT